MDRRPAPRRVLVIRPDHLGDVLLTGPTLARLRSLWPEAELTLLVGPWCADVAARLPAVDRVLPLDFPYFDRRGRTSRLGPYRRLLDAARSLRPDRFDAAVIARDDDRWSALLAKAAGIPVIAGHDTPRMRWVLTHRLPAAQRPVHVAAAGVALVEGLAQGRLGSARAMTTASTSWSASDATAITPTAHPLAFRLTEDDRKRAAELLGADARVGAPAGDARGPLAVHPGSGSPIKRWPAARWAAVVHGATAPGETVVLTGGPGEEALVAELAAALDRPVIDLAGRTDIGTLAAVFARCRVVAGPDSGPLHLAVAVGTPTVHLFGPADAARFGPWGTAERHAVVASGLVCAPCGRLDWPDPGDHPCVGAVEVGRVAGAVAGVVAPG